MTSVAFRQAYLLDTLGPHIVRDNSTADWALFDDPTTPQAKALQWMSEDDLFSSDPESMEDQTLLERYVLSVLAFSTDLQYPPYGWGWRNYSFLDPTRDVCDWNNDQGFPTYWSGAFCFDYANETTVSQLLLDFIGISGVVPWEVSLLKDLVILTMQDNSLTGTVPTELCALTKLTSLRLGANNMSGTIPSEIMNLPSLRLFSLEFNRLSGSIPSEVGLLSMVQEIRIESNNLSGTLPSEIGLLTDLDTLIIYDNPGLTGTIPSEYEYVSLLTFNFTNTSLTGSLDAIFCPAGGNPLTFAGDCSGPNPEIECWCCLYCCDADGEQCEYSGGYVVRDASPRQNPTGLLQLLLALVMMIMMFTSW